MTKPRPPLPSNLLSDFAPECERVRVWLESLRDDICSTFMALEHQLTGPMSERAPGCFVRTPHTRTDYYGSDGGGGVMSMMIGRVFEKVGVHTSTSYGELPPDFARQVSGGEEYPYYEHLAYRSHVEPQRTGRAYEHALLRNFEGMVRWWRRFEPHA